MAAPPACSYKACGGPPQRPDLGLPDPAEPLSTAMYSAICDRLDRWSAYDKECDEVLRQSQASFFRPGWFNFMDFLPDEGSKSETGLFIDAEIILRRDLAAGKVCWHAVLRKDLLEYYRNNHPILSIFSAHRVNILSRYERVFILFFHSLLVLMVSSATPRARACVQQTGLTCDDWYTMDGMNVEEASFCCLSRGLLLAWFVEHLSLGFGLGGTIYAIVVNTVASKFLQLAASCPCVQDSRRSFRRCMELFGHMLLVAAAALICIPLPKFFSYNIKHGLVGSMLFTFFTGKLGGLAFTTLVQTLFFMWKWRQQCPTKADGHFCCGLDFAPEGDDSAGRDIFYITAADYQNYVRAKGDGV